MTWTVRYTRTSLKELQKLPKPVATRILDQLDLISESDNPRSSGKALSGNLRTYWRYRIGDYRVICDIKDSEMLILVIKLGNRDKIYRK